MLSKAVMAETSVEAYAEKWVDCKSLQLTVTMLLAYKHI